MHSVSRVNVRGRVSLVGEHCDYARGISVAMPTTEGITAYGEPRLDQRFSLTSALDDQALRLTFSLDEDVALEEHPLRYSVAVLDVLRRRGCALSGMDILMNSNLPSKKGLASSAAVSVATTNLLNEAFHLGLSLDDVADIAYAAEHDLLDVKCGRMDQLAVSYNAPISLDFRNSANPLITRISYQPMSMHFLIGVPTHTKRAIDVILTATYRAYFNPTTKKDEAFRNALDQHIPQEVALPFIEAVRIGDAAAAGQCMRRNQQIYDRAFVPLCPSFDSPDLYRLLDLARKYGSLGEKWIGAGGAGAFICLTDSDIAREALKENIQQESNIDLLFVTADL